MDARLFAKPFGGSIQKAGYEAYIVGGGVRDIIAGFRPKDFDVVTNATPEQVKAAHKRAFIIGRRFKLVHVRMGRELVEVATFRAKPTKSWRGRSSAGMLKRDNRFGDIASDAFRRDITINALFYSPSKQMVYDFCNGVEDIKAKQIKIIGQPDERFTEDPVRMLRVVRLAAKLGFTIDAAIQKSIQSNLALLRPISAERLYMECVKLFYNGHAIASWQALKYYQMVDFLFPGLQDCDLEATSFAAKFLHEALASTDQRYMSGKTLSTAYLFSVFLWPVVYKFSSKTLNLIMCVCVTPGKKL